MAGVAIGIAIDASQSMEDIQNEAVAGFNQAMDELRREDEPRLVAMTVFRTAYTTPTVMRPVQEIGDLEVGSSYYVAGKTPLIDTVYNLIDSVEEALAKNPGYGGLVVVHTDGRENNSYRRWEEVRGRVQEKEREGWKFVYIGVGQEQSQAEWIAQKLGMTKGTALGVARAAIGASYAAVKREANTVA